MKIKDFVSEANWCQRALAMDSDGNKYNWPYSRYICKWCLTGMVLYCYNGDYSLTNIIMNKIEDKVGHIPTWNDRPERTWEDVRALAEELDI